MKYRLLNETDTIEATDEGLLDNCIDWEVANRWFVGCKYTPNFFVPMRRPLNETADMIPLFIPLKREYFEAFERGDKKHEYRPYGVRWNEKTCPVGRRVTLSLGYGRQRRLNGKVVSFEKSREPLKTLAWLKCYGHRTGDCAVIGIELESPNI